MMKKRSNPFRRGKAPEIKSNDATMPLEVALKCGQSNVNGISCIPSHNLFVVSTLSGVYVFDQYTLGKAARVFRKHKSTVRGAVHLGDDVMASVDTSGVLYTWSAGTGEVINQLKVSKHKCGAIAKANAMEIMVGTQRGEIIVVAHVRGKNLAVSRRFADEDKESSYYFLCAYNDTLVVVKESNVRVWSYPDGRLLHTIANEEAYRCAVSTHFIAVCRVYKIDVHKIRDGDYELLRTIDLREMCASTTQQETWIVDISFLTADIVIVAAGNTGVFLVSLTSGECVAHFQLHNTDVLYRAGVLSDGRICGGGKDGYCAIFKPPQDVELVDCISEYTSRMYSHPCLSILPLFGPPVRGSFEGIHDAYITVGGALEVASDPKFNHTSIQEWTYSHEIVMCAARAGVAPRDQGFWWDSLYGKASSLEMGEDDAKLASKFISEAETAGMLGAGGAERFQEARNSGKQQLTTQHNSLSTIIADLYCRQIALDEKVGQYLHSHKIVHRVAVIHALLACIPLAGRAAGHVLRDDKELAGPDVKEDFGTGSLVVTLFGMDKKNNNWTSFIRDEGVKHFLQGAQIVLEEDTWTGIPKGNRLAVEAAAGDLGLSIEKLRARIASCLVPTKAAVVVVEGKEKKDIKREESEQKNIIQVGNNVVDATAASIGAVSPEGLTEIWKKVQMLERRNEEQEEKMREMRLEINILKELNHFKAPEKLADTTAAPAGKTGEEGEKE